MDKQRGGSFTVNGWLALLLLVSAVGAGAAAYYLGEHRTIDITIPETTIKAPHDDKFKIRMFPPSTWVNTCDGFDIICYSKI